jgi:subtilisin family serine protease
MPRTEFVRTTTILLCLALASGSCGRHLSDAVSPNVNRAASRATLEEGQGPQRLVVAMLAPGTIASAELAEYGGEIVEYRAAEGLVSLRAGPNMTEDDLMSALAGDPRFVAVEPERWFETAESRQRSFAFDDGLGSAQTYAEQPAGRSIGLNRAHTTSLGSGVRVAILDTGADLTHPALQGAIVGGWDFVDSDPDPSDEANGIDDDEDGFVDDAYGHGTHVAGIVHLVAPSAELLVVRVLDAEGRGSLFQVAAGVRWAVSHGARVINLSLGSLSSSTTLEHALAEAEDQGVVVVTSAGNWGAEVPVEYPASSQHVFAVAAVDTGGVPADFTSRGPYVALSAPGVGVRSAYPGGQYRLWSGTSMSAPFVAGSAALLASQHPEWGPGDVRQQLSMTAGPIVDSPPNTMGAGRLDAGTAVAPMLISDEPEPDPEDIRPN